MQTIRGHRSTFRRGIFGSKESIERGAVIYSSDTAKNLSEAVLEAVQLGVPLPGAELHGVRLPGADLSRAQLRFANMRGADLRGADLTEADLRCNLAAANLAGAVLRNAKVGALQDADLTGADLSGVDLGMGPQGEYHLMGTKLNDADVAGARIYTENLVRVSVSRCRNLDRLVLIDKHTGRPVKVRSPGPNLGLEGANLRAIMKAHGLKPD